MACLPPPSGPGSVLRRQFNHLSVDTPQEAPVQLPDPDAYHLAALGSGSQELGLFWRAGRAGWGLRGRSRSRPARSTPDFITPQEPPGGSAFALAEKARRPRRGVGWLRSQLSRSGCLRPAASPRRALSRADARGASLSERARPRCRRHAASGHGEVRARSAV